MFCSKCGKEINDEAVVCVHCGCAVARGRHESGALAILSIVFAFVFPFIGYVLGLIGIARYRTLSYRRMSIVATGIVTMEIIILALALAFS